MTDQKPQLKKNSSMRSELIKASTIVYVVMMVVGFEICWWYHRNVKSLLGPIKYDHATTAGIVVASIFFLLVVQRVMEDFFPSYVGFKKRLASMFGGIGWLGACWLALISSFAEELLFRGAIQPFIGLWFTSALFGVLHLDPDEGISAWTVWAVLAGLLLGAVVERTGSLWPAVAIHFVVNFIGIKSLAKLKSASTLSHQSSPEEPDKL